MKDLNTDVARRVNGYRTTIPHSEYQMYPNIADDNELRQRRATDEPVEKCQSVACERLKTNIIYFLIITIVVLIGILCYTLVIVFEEKTDVLEPMIDVPQIDLPIEQRTWFDNGIDELRDSVKFHHNKQKAKNVILFVGDGMGVSTVTASRIYKYGEEGRLSWESFPHFGMLKVSLLLRMLCER